MYFNVNFNVFFKLIKVHLLVSELYIYQNARYNDNSQLMFCKCSEEANKKLMFADCVVSRQRTKKCCQ